jgi:hypothetical protein
VDHLPTVGCGILLSTGNNLHSVFAQSTAFQEKLFTLVVKDLVILLQQTGQSTKVQDMASVKVLKGIQYFDHVLGTFSSYKN